MSKTVRDGYFGLLHKVKTIHIVETSTHLQETIKSEYWIMKPLARTVIEEPSSNGGPNRRILSFDLPDGSIHVDTQDKTFGVYPRLPGSPFVTGLEPYLAATRPKYTLNGLVFEGVFAGGPVYKIQTGPQSIPGSMASVIVSRLTLIPVGWEYAVADRGVQEFHYVKFQLNEPMKPLDFAWKPPAGYKLKGDFRRKR